MCKSRLAEEQMVTIIREALAVLDAFQCLLVRARLDESFNGTFRDACLNVE